MLLHGVLVFAAEPAQTGPQTENRFPPLVVPEGFQATLFTCDPLIEYPSAIAVGPQERPGSIFVAIDYMTGLGTEIVRRDEIRLVEDTDGDRYADKATVYAGGFNSIMGLTSHGGTVYVMHSPLLTALKDTDGDGQADERRDLLTGLGLPPEENDVRLHCANGIVMGHDGWLYLALGDHGCDVPRPEGDRLVYHGGGILRCRPDGRDLHLFASGLRNIYDVALDEDLNVFVRDNENDGGDYKIRVCYSFHGADHGYPYLYYERQEEAIPPLADLGLGSSAGGAAYLERQFPAEYRGSLFFCEWGRSVVRYHPQRVGAGFAPLPESEFAAGAPSDPYGFKPTDLIVDRDGSLVVADWCDGQRPKRGRGRIYRITHRGAGVPPAVPGPKAGKAPAPFFFIAQLAAESHFDRVAAQDAVSALGPGGMELLMEALNVKGKLNVLARMHAVWILARDDSDAARETLFQLAAGDPDPRVQVQAVRALADRYDPVLVTDRLDAGPADAAIAARLAALADGKDPRVVLEIIVAVGRWQWNQSPEWLRTTLASQGDIHPILSHAAQQTLRRCGNWPAVLRQLDLSDDEAIRPIALRAVAGQHVAEVVDGLIARLATSDVKRHGEYADALTRVWKRPAPWVYWGYRPLPRPAHSVSWERTAAIEQALDRTLSDADPSLRLATLRRMQRESISANLERLATWLADERDEEAVSVILQALPAEPADQRRAILTGVVLERGHPAANRLRALDLLARERQEPGRELLRQMAQSLEDGVVLAEVLDRIGGAGDKAATELLLGKLDSAIAPVRAAAVGALARFEAMEAGSRIIRLLEDEDAGVRQAAAAAAGRLKLHAAAEPLLRLASAPDPLVRRASLISLREIGERRAVPPAVAALAEGTTQLAALECLAELGDAGQARAVMGMNTADASEAVVMQAARTLGKWRQEPAVAADQQAAMESAIREMQGRSGLVVCWKTSGPLSADALAAALPRTLEANPSEHPELSGPLSWQSTFAAGVDARVTLAPESKTEDSWLSFADVTVTEPTPVQFLASAQGKLQVWQNGRLVHERREPRLFAADSDRFDATLAKGVNRIVILVTPAAGKAEFHLRFRRRSSAAQHEQLTQAALSRTGDAERGRKLFLDAAKTQCVKCHRMGSDGERIGPELTGLGDRFSRIHIVESILDPSRTVTPGFQTLLVRLTDGQTISGIKIAENEQKLTLADQKGEKHVLAKADIEAQQPQPKSTMPDNLAQQFSTEQFVDLVTFLVSQKQER